MIKNVKMTKDETDFLKEYRRLEDLEREKGIKFFECIGDPPITAQTIQYIEDKRTKIIETRQAEMRDKDINRFAPTIDSDRVVVDTNT